MSDANMIENEDDVIEGGDKELDLNAYFGDKEKRWYQIASHNAVIGALREGVKRILIKQPTGTGKTITIAMTLSDAAIKEALGVPMNRNLRVLFMAHKHRLLTQAERTFADGMGVDLILQSAFSEIPKKVQEDGWDVCVIDEAHHEAMMTIQYQLEKIGDFPIIGMTATDERADGAVIKFERIIEPISREQAVREGWLADTKIHTVVDPTSGNVNKVQIISDLINNFHHEMDQTMVFLKTIKEATAIHELLLSLGKKSVLISKQSESFVNDTLDQFSRGEVQFVVNCNKINEGVDVKGCSHVILGRQYGSYPQLNQVIGRAARPDSDCNVWELINPLSGKNLDTTVVVGTPEQHRLLFKRGGQWVVKEFDYTSNGSILERSTAPDFNPAAF